MRIKLSRSIRLILIFLLAVNSFAAVADFEKAMELDPGMGLRDLIEKSKVVLKFHRGGKTDSKSRADKREGQAKTLISLSLADFPRQTRYVSC